MPTMTAYSTLYTDAGPTGSRAYSGVQWHETRRGGEGLLPHRPGDRGNDGPGTRLVWMWAFMDGWPHATTSWSWLRWLKHPAWNHSGSGSCDFSSDLDLDISLQCYRAFPIDMTQEPLLEPLATMGVLVGATRRVKIGTAVLVMPYRHPVLLARMLVTLDVLSGGRTLLGAGVGWLAESLPPWIRPLPRAVGSQTSVSRLSDAYARGRGDVSG